MADKTLNPNHKRTQRAREAFAERFTSPEAKTAYYRALGQRSAEDRVILTGDEANALREAYRFLRTIAPKIDLPDEAA